MCGIAGVCGAAIERSLLREMCELIRYRGPDDEGYYLEDDIGFGVRRLSIIDLETGAQPIHNEDRTLWLVFNGEIFNYLELRAELEKTHKFYTKSDTEVIVHLYEEIGEKCVEKLNGMFAFALWDRTKRSLFLARDRVGVKPLYYNLRDGKLIFASEIKAILRAGVRAEPNNSAIFDYMTLGYVLGDKTFFIGIKQLEPGHWATFQSGKLLTRQYWDLEYSEVDMAEPEVTRRLRELLEEAIRIRLRSDVPLGCHLSGGIDSSAVTCTAGKLLSTQVKTFTGAFNEGPEYDETFYAKLVSEHAKTEYHEIRPNGVDFIPALDKLIWYMDYPEVGPGIYSQYHVCRLARDHVKVVLGGQGGDEVFAGYPWFIRVELEHTIAKARNPFTKLKALIQYLRLAKQGGMLIPESKRLMARLVRNGGLDLTERFYRDRWLHSDAETSQMFTNRFLSEIEGYTPRNEFSSILNKPRSDSFMDKSQYYYLKTYLAGLLHVEDRTSMAVSLESRVPLCCDHNLLEFAASIKPSLRAKSSVLKYALREAIRDIVPREIYQRHDKRGFPTPFNIWLRQQAELVRRILQSEAASSRGVFDPRYVEAILREHESGLRDRGFTIFMMLCVEFWFRNFMPNEREDVSTVLLSPEFVHQY